ncbi:hypothetical protein GCM10010124_33010 [Pilimelia terevasa]|uniref:Secreted protein n=1 Tax=Pilimelia terevasa TaxID=53372 RepID=A0A8J3FJI6_9ACTN|nr:hypothetical protein [Pilimelia terevasa]GGK37605.1 hypothetical protein GCM10010124_33010 [Pilimelia terevasa]
MSTPGIIVLVVVLALVAAAAAVGALWYRRQRLRRVFGPEYDRALASAPDRRAAEEELRDRERRHEDLTLREIPAEARRAYHVRWNQIQEQFVDDPAGAVRAADVLLTTVIGERGYPTDGYDQQVADLSVEHADVLHHYRAAHAVSDRAAADTASTEDLRQALVHYRQLVATLLGADTDTGRHRTDGAAHGTDPRHTDPRHLDGHDPAHDDRADADADGRGADAAGDRGAGRFTDRQYHPGTHGEPGRDREYGERENGAEAADGRPRATR